ncbi:MAG: HAD family hydrolase [Planctomycetota bacterium]|jgi:HAD superfamily hydrolase (TIGR01509 family)
MIKAVLFDMDGVLIDSYRAWFEVVNAAARHYGKNEITPQQFEKAWGQSTEADVEKFFQGCTILEIEEYYRAHFTEFHRYITIMPGAHEAIRGLRERGIKTALITNSWAPLAKDVLEKLEIECDILIGDGDVEKSKPAPDMIFKACELLGVDIPEVIFVGDSNYDLEAARSAGVRFIAFGRLEADEKIMELSGLLQILSK